MKKWALILTASTGLLLGGCSLLEETSDTLTYVKDATNYVNEAAAFAQDIPSLVEQAVADPQLIPELETKLEEMQQDLEVFNDLQVPEVATDIHQQIVEQNDVISAGIDTYFQYIEDGSLNPAILEDTEVFQTVEDITNILDQIQELGQ